MNENCPIIETSHESRGDKRRRELVCAASHLIAEKGFEGLRVRDVAAAAGVNIATLHYYFPEKEDLIHGVLEHIMQEFKSSNASIIHDTEMSAADQLKAVIINLENRVRDHSELFVVIHEITSRAHRVDSIRETLAGISAGWRAHMSSLIAAGHADGSISTDTDPELAATALIAMIRGLTIQVVYRMDESDFPSIAKLVVGWISGAKD